MGELIDGSGPPRSRAAWLRAATYRSSESIGLRITDWAKGAFVFGEPGIRLWEAKDMGGPAPTEKVRVVVGDDHPIYREGMVRALSLSGLVDVVGEADDGASAWEMIKTHRPDVALLDYQMPGMDGVQVAAAVNRDELPTRVLLLSAYDESAIVYQALQQGAAGFLPKESTRTEIVKAVLDCAKGRDVVSPALVTGLAGEIRRRAEPAAPLLSAREREVLGRIARGQSIPAIAAELYLAPSTVKTHVQRLYEKLGVSDRAAAVAEAMRRRLLD